MRRAFLTAVVITAAILLVLLLVNVVRAQSATCAEHAAVVKRLADRYGEARHSIGIAQDNSVVEIFASKETRTWTITVTAPAGPTCLVAAGDAFEVLDESLPSKGAPA